MGTRWIELITDHALVYIDDVRLTDELRTSPSLFFRRMALIVKNALPMVDKPPELRDYIMEGITYPEYDEAEWISDEQSLTSEAVFESQKTGFDMCSAVLRKNESGTVSFIPIPVRYDPETGNVTFPQQEKAGEEYQLDFYTDGSFLNDLSLVQKRLIGLAVTIVWDERFSRNWLNMQEKLKDQSSNAGSESNYINAVGNRLAVNRAAFFAELDKYEQDVAYKNIVPKYRNVIKLI